MALIEALEDIDDVQNVYHNLEIQEYIMGKELEEYTESLNELYENHPSFFLVYCIFIFNNRHNQFATITMM